MFFRPQPHNGDWMAGGGKSSDLDGVFPAPPAAKYCTIQNRPGNVTMKNYQNVTSRFNSDSCFGFKPNRNTALSKKQDVFQLKK